MKYTIEIGKIVEGALKFDKIKVYNYTKQLIAKLEEDKENIAAIKFNRLLVTQTDTVLSAMNMNKDTHIPIDTESRTSLADIINPDKNNMQVILSKNNFKDLNSFILGYKETDKLRALGIENSNTLLLYGPPGCGKTKCAYLIAKELHLPLVIARLDSLISSYLGTTAKNIRRLFEFVQKAPCVLFLDEFDAIAKARDDSHELGELKRVVNSLLQNVDSMSNDSLLLAATNHEVLLDSAVWRRFNYKLKIELPDTEAIIKLIDLFINNHCDLNDKDKLELATAFDKLTGACIEEIITKALKNSIIYDKQFTKLSIYEEFFEFKKVFPQNCDNEKERLKIKAKFLRECSDKIFSFQVIADILSISKTAVSTIVKERRES